MTASNTGSIIIAGRNPGGPRCGAGHDPRHRPGHYFGLEHTHRFQHALNLPEKPAQPEPGWSYMETKLHNALKPLLRQQAERITPAIIAKGYALLKTG